MMFMNMALIDSVMPVHFNYCFNNIIKLRIYALLQPECCARLEGMNTDHNECTNCSLGCC